MKTVAFLDLDGVLTNDNHRIKYALAKEWEAYFDKDRIMADPAWDEGRALAKALRDDPDTEIHYLTGRREDLKAVSTVWLMAHGFPRGQVYTRPFSASGVPLAVFKAGFIGDYKRRHPMVNVVLYDDDPEVIRVVQETFGVEAAVHCTWHIKKKALIKKASV